jgi:hypothetical protein
LQTLNVNCVCIAASGAPLVRSRVNAACSLTSDPLGGLAEHVHRSVRTPLPVTRGKMLCYAFSPRNGKRTSLPQTFGKFCAQLTIVRQAPVLGRASAEGVRMVGA